MASDIDIFHAAMPMDCAIPDESIRPMTFDPTAMLPWQPDHLFAGAYVDQDYMPGMCLFNHVKGFVEVPRPDSPRFKVACRKAIDAADHHQRFLESSAAPLGHSSFVTFDDPQQKSADDRIGPPRPDYPTQFKRAFDECPKSTKKTQGTCARNAGSMNSYGILPIPGDWSCGESAWWADHRVGEGVGHVDMEARSDKPLKHHAKRASYTRTEWTPCDDEQEITTYMIHNVPNEHTGKSFIEDFERIGLEGKFNFVYLPMDKRSRQNIGYAFVNFVTEQAAKESLEILSASQGMLSRNQGHHRSPKSNLWFSKAHLQGLKQNVEHYQNTFSKPLILIHGVWYRI